jgi:hypothetical protein
VFYFFLKEKDKMEVFPRLMVGGGLAYYGPTAQRDKEVVRLAAMSLYGKLGDTIEIVTGGMSGIPDDFARTWLDCGGTHVLCVVSSEHLHTYLKTQDVRMRHIVIGENQTARRLALPKLEGIRCALFVQGGMYTTHEMQLFEEAHVPIVTHWGSGGAAGGEQPYNGYTYTKKPSNEYLCSTDPTKDAYYLAFELATAVIKWLN